MKIRPIETPGHLSDHLCFLYEERFDGQVKSTFHIFSGDSIVDGDSVFYQDYPRYYYSLVKTQKLVKEYNCQQLFVAHSSQLKNENIVFDAPSKVKSYVDIRAKKDANLEVISDRLFKQQGPFTIDEFNSAFRNKDNKPNQVKTNYKLGRVISQEEKKKAYQLRFYKYLLVK